MTDIILKFLGVLYKFYPVKLYIRKRVESYFFKYHVAQILNEASKAYRISEYRSVKDLLHRSPFRGTLSELVRVGDFYPSPKNLAVAINISFGVYCNEGYFNKDKVIDLAFHLAQEIKSRFISDELLKSVFEDLNKDFNKILTTGDRLEIERLFSNKKELFISYFSTFSKSEFNYSIKIWHESQDKSYIEWQEKDSITVHLNPMRIREGFFRVGFDYYCNESKRKLGRATRFGGYEYFDGDLKGKVIWAK